MALESIFTWYTNSEVLPDQRWLEVRKYSQLIKALLYTNLLQSEIVKNTHSPLINENLES
jgi:hypothetical protein